jgi:hypothetical protein
LGCKSDLEDERKVNMQDAQQLAKEYNMKFYEVSAIEWIKYRFNISKSCKRPFESANNFEIPRIDMQIQSI